MIDEVDKSDELGRFALFAGANWEASGGWKDLIGTFKTEDEARKAVKALRERDREWWEIVDLRQCQIVASGVDEDA